MKPAGQNPLYILFDSFVNSLSVVGRVIFFALCLFALPLLFALLLSPPANVVVYAKHFVLSVLVWAAAFHAAARYLKEIYEIPRLQDAVKYLLSVCFGIKIPVVEIREGAPFPAAGEFHPIFQIGGPGVLEVKRDNLVVVETLRAHKNVFFAGRHRLSRFDLIKDILSTEEQFGEIAEVKATTLDGIAAAVKGVQFRYRVDGSFQYDKDSTQPVFYKPSKRAVIHLVYLRAANKEGKIPPWTEAVSGKVGGIIREHINNSFLEDLIAPRGSEEHPLERLRAKFVSLEEQKKFKEMGVRLSFCSIGELVVPIAEVDKEHLKMWFVRQAGVRKVIHAQGDAESFASQERGRTEGQAMLLKSVAHALQELGVDGKDAATVRKNLRNILLTRTAQILEARTSLYRTRDEEELKNEHKGNLRPVD
ncbi:MAG: hypothetical protein LDL51_04585 [Chloroflexi bacterium]|nr:hypothetical protein [Chloroflexota bacterium]